MGQVSALETYRYPSDSSQYFKCAAIALLPLNTDRVVATARADIRWDAFVDGVKDGFARLLRCESRQVSVFFNTTAAVQRILLRLRRVTDDTCPTLLVTDLEYPGIIAAAHELWPGNIVQAQVATHVWSGQTATAADALMRSFISTRPGVLFVSHVDRSTGWQIPTALLMHLRQLDPRCVFVIDGAQGAGNVLISDELMSVIDFYVTSGHKWLSGQAPLGLVYAASGWQIDDPAQSYSSRVGSAGTGSLESLVSTRFALEDFNGISAQSTPMDRMRAIQQRNRQLAEHFIRQMRRRCSGLELIGSVGAGWKRNGIVSVTDPMKLLDLNAVARAPFKMTHFERGTYVTKGTITGSGRRLRYSSRAAADRTMVEVDIGEIETPGPADFWRIAIHYYHSLEDVDQLVAFWASCVT